MLKNELHSSGAAERIEAELEELENIAARPSSAAEHPPSTPWRDFPGFWQKAREISELFRSSDLTYEDRTRLWKQHQDLCEQVSKLRARERRLRQEASKASCVQVMSILDDVRRSLSAAQAPDDLVQVRLKLDRAVEVLKRSFFLRSDRHESWRAWHQADHELFIRRRQLLPSQKRHRTAADTVVRQTIDMLTHMRERKAQSREKLLREMDGLQEDINRSWKLEWAGRAKTWVQEKRSKVEEIDRDIEELDRQVQDLKGRLSI